MNAFENGCAAVISAVVGVTAVAVVGAVLPSYCTSVIVAVRVPAVGVLTLAFFSTCSRTPAGFVVTTTVLLVSLLLPAASILCCSLLLLNMFDYYCI